MEEMEKNNAEDLTFLLLTEGHIIKPFDCEDEDLNDFLFNEAIPYKEQMLATTFILESSERTLGYYSVLSDGFRVEENLFLSKSQYKKFLKLVPHSKRHLKNIPAVKIGRLAIDKTYKGKGLGSIFINNIIKDCLELNTKQACRLLLVDAYKQALPFYEKIGFRFLTNKDEREDTRLMFLDLIKMTPIEE